MLLALLATPLEPNGPPFILDPAMEKDDRAEGVGEGVRECGGCVAFPEGAAPTLEGAAPRPNLAIERMTFPIDPDPEESSGVMSPKATKVLTELVLLDRGISFGAEEEGVETDSLGGTD